MIRVEAWRGDPGSGFLSELSYVQDVIQMAVGDENAADRKMVPSLFPKGVVESFPGSNETGIDQIEAVFIPENMEVHPMRANG